MAEVGWKKELEREVLGALIASHTPLLRIFAIALNGSALFLRNLFTKARPPPTPTEDDVEVAHRDKAG